MAVRTPASPHAPGPDGQVAPLPGLTVTRVIGKLQAGYQQDAPWAVASVARLRREAGREAHTSPTAWGLDHLETLAELREGRRKAEQEARGSGTPDPAFLASGAYLTRETRELREDTAVHLAVTLWALHQQSLRDDPMHRPGWTLGRSVRRLGLGRTGTRDASTPKDDGGTESPGGPKDATGGAASEDVAETVRQRFVRVGGASDAEVLAIRLRELVLLLRGARIPLDYVLLADQLFRWQDENQRDTVRRAWGRDFHRRYRTAGTTPGQSPANNSPDEPDDDLLAPENYAGDV